MQKIALREYFSQRDTTCFADFHSERIRIGSERLGPDHRTLNIR
jgi:hypothetical protein